MIFKDPVGKPKVLEVPKGLPGFEAIVQKILIQFFNPEKKYGASKEGSKRSIFRK